MLASVDWKDAMLKFRLITLFGIALIGSLLMFSLEIVFALYNRLAAWINVSHFGGVSIWSAAFGSFLKQFDPPS